MKKSNLLKGISSLVIALNLIGCTSKATNDGFINNSTNNNSDEKVELVLWSHYDGLESVIEEFEKENPNITVKVESFGYDEYAIKYKESLLKDEGDADLFIIDSNQYGEFNSINGLEDLLKEEHKIAKYESNYDKELWSLGKSMDGKRLLGLPIASAPIVTYYRADILEENGFPSDPAELSEFMKDKDNWFKIARKLREKDIYTLQWIGEVVKFATSDMPYYNEKLEYQRDNERFKEAISIAKQAKYDGLAVYTDIWTEKGQELLKDGKLAMLYLGSWGSRELEAMVPEQKGKWRVTTLPFGVYGWNNASIISAAENSKNKEAAIKFIEYYAFKYNDKERVGNVAGYLPFRNNPDNINKTNAFLGGQNEQAFYESVMQKTEEYNVTALDDDTFKLWDTLVNIGIDNDDSDEKIMESIRVEVGNKFEKEREIILNELNK